VYIKIRVLFLKGTNDLKIKKVLFSLILIIVSLSLLACHTPEEIPTEEDLMAGGYWYNEDRSTCFKFHEKSDTVTLYSLNSGSNTYNFGNTIDGVYSVEECTLTFGESVKYYVRDGSTLTIDEEKFTLDIQNVPTLNTTPMESAPVLTLGTPMTLIPSNPGINEKIYLKFTPEGSDEFLFDFAISEPAAKQRSMGETDTTYIWILNSDFVEIASGVDDITVSLKEGKTYYVIATVSAVSSETGTNTLTVTIV